MQHKPCTDHPPGNQYSAKPRNIPDLLRPLPQQQIAADHTNIVPMVERTLVPRPVSLLAGVMSAVGGQPEKGQAGR
jgi:hypothetical protein